VVVVGADKGGVGKTTVSAYPARLFQRKQRSDPGLRHRAPARHAERFHPEITEIVDMTATPDQMKIFDTLNTVGPSVTVIDVRAGLMHLAGGAARYRLLDAAKSGQITFAVFHILGSSIASLDENRRTASFMSGAKYFLVKNFINNTSFFEWDQATTTPISTASRMRPSSPSRSSTRWPSNRSRSPPCRSSIRRQQRHPREAANTFLRAARYVRHWLANVWSEFDRIKLTVSSAPVRQRSAPAAKK